MLKMIHGKVNLDSARTRMGEAGWPLPFPQVLEYGPPAHGTWNIVHTGMLIEGAHQIYVCAGNCNRGVVLTAAEMGAADRFSHIEIMEEDLWNGRMEELIIEGVDDILQKLPCKPTAVLLFTVCVHRFMGTDLDYIFSELRSRHPDIMIIDCYMDCIAQKDGIFPSEKLRISMYKYLKPLPCREKQVNLIGNDLPTARTSEMMQMLMDGGYKILDLADGISFGDYRQMAASGISIATHPLGKSSCEQLSGRLGMTALYMPVSFSYEEIEEQLRRLAQAARLPVPDFAALRGQADAALCRLKEEIGDTAIAIDAAAFSRILGLAGLLLNHGLRVVRIYADAFSEEEKEDYLYLKEHYPQLELYPTMHPDMRLMPREYPEKIIAIGQKAAYFTGTSHFVNVVENGGLHGFDGIVRLCGMIAEAGRQEKDTEDHIVRKGLGLTSLACP